MTIDVYKAERELIAKKIPAVSIEWQDKPIIEQVISPLLDKEETDRIYIKLSQNFKTQIDRFYKLQAERKLKELLKIVCPPSTKNLYRIVISIKLFRELFADDLFGAGGSGKAFKRSNLPESMQMRPR